MDDLLEALARISERLEHLESRVSALERSPKIANSRRAATAPASATPAVAESALSQDGGVFPVVGKAMLGIAGAYLLRALAESGSLPQSVVVALALAYAGMWLLWAARVSANSPFASVAYAVTSGLILSPMLWELTLRFKVLPGWVTAGVLIAFVASASALAWKRNLTPVLWIANITAVFTALALLIATHDLEPFISALLIMAVISEFAAHRKRWLGLRFLVAPAADLAVWIPIYIYSLPQSSRLDYTPIQSALLLTLPSVLFLIYGASVTFRTTWLRQQITIFEIVQTVIAFLLAAFSLLELGPVVRTTLGIFCLVISAAGYAVAFALFDRLPEQRNYYVYSTWSALLLLAGSFLCLPPLQVALLLSAAAILATVIGVRRDRLTPEFHGLLYLAAAAFASGLLEYAVRALAGTFPSAPGWMVWLVAASVLLCYAVGGRFPGERWNQRLLRLLSAILAVSAAATLLVSVLVWLAAIGMTPGAAHIAVIRTLITCALALTLAYGGSRWQRIELVWTAYGTLAFVTAKLLFEDLPHGHSGSIAISIFLYAVALIIVPRMARLGSQRRKEKA
jgi:hypothetical protein